MVTQTLRWGLLGTARINEKLIPALRASSRNQLLAISSRSVERARDAARQWDIPRFYGSYRAMLTDPEIDIVYNPLPNSLHAEWTIQAAQAGKHVLCEKPLALSSEQMQVITAEAHDHGVVVVEALMYLHHPLTLKIKEIVDSGLIGPLQLIRAAFTFSLADDRDIRLNPDLGGGCLWDAGCYPVSLARYLAGTQANEVFGWQEVGPTNVDIAFTGQMRFPSGSRDLYAQFDCGLYGPYRKEVEIVGSQGIIRVENLFKAQPSELLLVTGRKRSEVILMPNPNLYSGEVEDLTDAVISGRSPRVGLDFSQENIAVMEALSRSAREGRPVALN